jgi:hypothetical protein
MVVEAVNGRSGVNRDWEVGSGKRRPRSAAFSTNASYAVAVLEFAAGTTVVCFSESPIDVLARLFASTGHSFRYRPFGIMVPKAWLFAKGGRPVIYQPEADFELLPQALQHRHVRFDEPGKARDFTFEREWRIAADELHLEPASCTLIVPDREWDYRLREEHEQRDMLRARALGMNPFVRISNYDWHVLALGDLGARFPLNDDTP